MELRRFCSVLALAAALTLAVGLGIAGADAGTATQVVIDDGGPTGALGHVSSKQPKCLRGRRVTLNIVDAETGKLLEIEATITDSHGDWEVEEALFAGDYVATVDSKQVKVGKKRRSCRGDRSPRKHL